jgi:hypothetical protein
MKLILVIFATVFTLAVSQMATPPVFPTAFTVDIEANIWERGVTLNKREYYDSTQQQARYEINNADTYTVTYVNFKTKKQYTLLNNKQCSPEIPLPPADPIMGRGTVEDMVNIANNYNVSLVGSDEVRGIRVDVFATYLNDVAINGTVYPNGSMAGGIATYNGVVNYYYTVPSWNFRVLNVTRKLVRVSINVTRTDANGTMTYSHSYEFINFVSKPVDPTVFATPTVCATVTQNVVEILSKPEGQGLAAGMFFFGAFIGAVIACLSIWGYCRRRQQQREKFQRSSMEMTRL